MLRVFTGDLKQLLMLVQLFIQFIDLHLEVAILIFNLSLLGESLLFL